MATTTQSLFISILSATVYCNLEIFLECFAKWTWIFSTFVLILSLDYEECVFLTFRRWIEPRFPKKAELSKYHNIGRISACSNVNMIPQRFHAENFAIESNSFWNSSYFEWKGQRQNCRFHFIAHFQCEISKDSCWHLSRQKCGKCYAFWQLRLFQKLRFNSLSKGQKDTFFIIQW